MKTTLVLLAAAALLAGCSRTRPAEAAQPETVRDVAVIPASKAVVPDTIEAVGTVAAAQTAQLSAEVVGTVRQVRVAEGQRVRRGEVLIVLDDAQQRAAVQQAQAAKLAAEQQIAAATAEYELASATLKRYQILQEKKAVSPHEFDEVQARFTATTAQRSAAQAGLEQARAAEAQARTVLAFTTIRAPFEGVVTAKRVDPGALAAPGTPLLTVEDTGHFRLEASVDESNLRFVKMGETVPVGLDALNGDVEGKVAQIVPAADPASRSFVVKVALPADARLRSGLFGRAQFARGTRESVIVPRTAVLEHGQLQGVYVVGQQGDVSLRYVTLGKPIAQNVEILSGLSDGERLISAPAGRDLAGKRIAN
ncbi:MAG TPA: efflux RND transporter periplasmic adaptor subunit [Terriglobales bacterium]|nr:efflux RND transporter periplasmic adaptor subunit [Terriglobales bacterium]